MNTDNDFLTGFVQQLSEQQKHQNAVEERRNYFRRIGKKGGEAKRKSAKYLTKKITIRFSEKEVKNLELEAQKNNLKLATYLRFLITQNELKINEFVIDEVLISFANKFKNITNLLRNREFSKLENKNEILHEIQELTKQMRHYFLNRKQDE